MRVYEAYRKVDSVSETHALMYLSLEYVFQLLLAALLLQHISL